jgi:hypothetical protein
MYISRKKFSFSSRILQNVCAANILLLPVVFLHGSRPASFLRELSVFVSVYVLNLPYL